MPRRLRPLLALILVVPIAGCEAMAQAFCRGEGERAGIYLGREYTGQSCSTSTQTSRDGRYRSTTTNCTPTFRDRYQWTPNSDRVYAVCMARLVPPPQPVRVAPQGAPVQIAPQGAPVQIAPPVDAPPPADAPPLAEQPVKKF